MHREHERASLARMSWGIVLVGLAFAGAAMLAPDIMSPEVYGPKAYAVDAEVWSLSFIASGGLVLYGVHINGRKPLFTPALRVLGLTVLGSLFGFLAYSAAFAPSGSVVVIFSAVYFIPEIIGYMRTDLRLLRTRWRAHGLRSD